MSDFAAAREKHRSKYAQLRGIYSSSSTATTSWASFEPKATPPPPRPTAPRPTAPRSAPPQRPRSTVSPRQRAAPSRRPATARPARTPTGSGKSTPRTRSAPIRRRTPKTARASTPESAFKPVGIWMGGCWRPTSQCQAALCIGISGVSKEECTDGVERCLRAALAELLQECSTQAGLDAVTISPRDMAVESVTATEHAASRRILNRGVLVRVSIDTASEEATTALNALLQSNANQSGQMGLTSRLQVAAQNQGLRISKQITVLLRSASFRQSLKPATPEPDSPPASPSPPATPAPSSKSATNSEFAGRSAKFALAALSRALTEKEFETKYGQSKKIFTSFKAHATGPTLELRPLHHSTCLISPRYHEATENPALQLAKELAEQSNFSFADVAEAQIRFGKLSHDTGFIDRSRFARLVSRQGVMSRDVADALFGVFAEVGREILVEQGVMSFSGFIKALAVLQGGEMVRTLHMKSIFRYMDRSHAGVLQLMDFLKFFPGKSSETKQIFDEFAADERGIDLKRFHECIDNSQFLRSMFEASSPFAPHHDKIYLQKLE